MKASLQPHEWRKVAEHYQTYKRGDHLEDHELNLLRIALDGMATFFGVTGNSIISYSLNLDHNSIVNLQRARKEWR